MSHHIQFTVEGNRIIRTNTNSGNHQSVVGVYLGLEIGVVHTVTDPTEDALFAVTVVNEFGRVPRVSLSGNRDLTHLSLANLSIFLIREGRIRAYREMQKVILEKEPRI